jgi:hypothetical protein
MTLANFTLFYCGILCELLLLIESANPAIASKLFDMRGNSLVGYFMPPTRALASILLALALGIAGLFRLLGYAQIKVYIDTPIVNILMIVLGLFILFTAIMTGLFLPLVNEQTILVVQCLILYQALTGDMPFNWISLVGWTLLPTLIVLGLVLWPRPLPFALKALLYLWYLLSLLVMPFQSGQVAYFRQLTFTWVEAWSYGALFIFMIIHGLFAVRFFLMTSSLLVPRNWPLMERFIPHVFSDEQVPRLRFLLVMGISAGLLAGNHYLGWVAQPVALGLLVMFSSQILAWWPKAGVCR